MKMIWHQAPCQNIGIRCYISFGLLKKKQIVFAIEKKGLRVVPTVKNVIYVIWFELHIGWFIYAFKDNILSIRCYSIADFTLLLSNLLLSRWREVTSSTSALFTCWLSPTQFTCWLGFNAVHLLTFSVSWWINCSEATFIEQVTESHQLKFCTVHLLTFPVIWWIFCSGETFIEQVTGSHQLNFNAVHLQTASSVGE